MYDPETRKFTMVDLCFGTQHLMFAEDADNTSGSAIRAATSSAG